MPLRLGPERALGGCSDRDEPPDAQCGRRRARIARQRDSGDDQRLGRRSSWHAEYRHTAPWHYVNIPDGESYETSEKNKGGDIVTALRECEATLRNPRAPREKRAEALKFYVHFVADIHQPLHAGRNDDRGGNEVKVYWFSRREPANLHSVWDTLLFESENLSYLEFTAFIDNASPNEIRQWQNSQYLDWVRESMELRASCYEFTPGQPLGYGYTARHVPVVKRRLLEAGIRLAGKLNEIFR